MLNKFRVFWRKLQIRKLQWQIRNLDNFINNSPLCDDMEIRMLARRERRLQRAELLRLL